MLVVYPTADAQRMPDAGRLFTLFLMVLMTLPPSDTSWDSRRMCLDINGPPVLLLSLTVGSKMHADLQSNTR